MIDLPGTKSLLVVGAHPAAEGLTAQLGGGWALRAVPGLLDAVALLARERMDVVMADHAQVGAAVSALEEVRRLQPETAVVVTSESPRYVPGADDCVVVPCDMRVLVNAIERARLMRRSQTDMDAASDEREGLRREANEQRERAGMLEKAWDRMSTAVNSGEALTRTIIEIAAELSGATRLSLMLVGDNGKRDLRIIEAQGLSDSVVAATHLRLGEGVAGWVAKHGRPLRSEDRGTADASSAGNAEGYRSDTYLSLPLRIGDEVLGVINMTERAGGRPFSDEEVRQLAFLANQVAIWIRHARKLAQAERQSLMDALTGLYNRRYFMDAMAREIERSRRNGECFSLGIIDIDHFKDYNDTHGHQAGDDLLRQFSLVMQKNLRGSDIVCRYGGEEFAVIMPRTGDPGAHNQPAGEHFIDRLRETISRFPFLGLKDHKEGRLTVSAGVAVFPEDGETPDALIGAADKALYRAKKEGRNRVCANQAERKPRKPAMGEKATRTRKKKSV